MHNLKETQAKTANCGLNSKTRAKMAKHMLKREKLKLKRQNASLNGKMQAKMAKRELKHKLKRQSAN